MFEIIFFILIIGYFFQLFIFTIGVQKKFPQINEEELLTATVIVAARDEENNILRCLKSLDKLIYPDGKLEIILVDDLRKLRNDIIYYGKKVNKEFLVNNESEIKRLGVKIGDTVIEERAGDLIPVVSKVIKELRTGKEKIFLFPKKCPTCETKLIKLKDEVVWRCKNTKCLARKKEILRHFVSKKSFDIVGMGPKIVEKLITEKLIFQPSDIFELKEGDIMPLEKFAEKSSKNLIESIERSKKIELS
ncbi:MAG: hypothetical protein IIB83_07500, partial [Bacteroidetes bacterium]|nr:hypothetical protein [Bacteroidota bacterium]